MRQKVSMDAALTGLFVVMLLLLLFYETLKEVYPGPATLSMLFGQAIGLVFLGLLVFSILGLVLLVIRRLYSFCRGG